MQEKLDINATNALFQIFTILDMNDDEVFDIYEYKIFMMLTLGEQYLSRNYRITEMFYKYSDYKVYDDNDKSKFQHKISFNAISYIFFKRGYFKYFHDKNFE